MLVELSIKSSGKLRTFLEGKTQKNLPVISHPLGKTCLLLNKTTKELKKGKKQSP